MSNTTADVIIIGTGIIGNAIAYEMAKTGLKTISVDKNSQIGFGSTAGSCAIIRMHYSTFDGTAMAWEGYHYWRDWQDYLGLKPDTEIAKFKETGCLVMKTASNNFLEKHMKYSGELNCPFEEWDQKRVLSNLPIYSLDSFSPARGRSDPSFGEKNGKSLSGGVFWPKAGYVTDPALSAQNIAQAAKACGSSFLMSSTVTSILQANGKVTGVELMTGEKIHAPVVVNVAGPASSKINELARVLDDMTIKTRALRQEVVHLPSPQNFNFEKNGIIVSDSDIACYCRPEHGNNILVGSEDPECDKSIWVDDPDNFDQNFTEQWMTQAMRYGQRVPTLGIPQSSKGVVDLYDTSTDWIPIYDKSQLPGYYMACGSSGNQYKNAIIAGKMMTSLVEYCEAGNDHDNKPLRFKLPHIDKEIGVEFYSRKRMVNKESSFSVLG